MSRPRDARLTRERTREVCQRTGSSASIEGSIASLGSHYVLGLKAVNCRNGDMLAEEQVTAHSKEQVLKAIGEAGTKMREKLGESLASVEKYDTPPENGPAAISPWANLVKNAILAPDHRSFGPGIRLFGRSPIMWTRLEAVRVSCVAGAATFHPSAAQREHNTEVEAILNIRTSDSNARDCATLSRSALSYSSGAMEQLSALRPRGRGVGATLLSCLL
jgi:hypothetical protein